MNQDEDEEEGAEAEMGKIQKSNRFEALGKAKQGFKGAEDGGEREAGPVMFEKDKDDPFGIGSLIGEVKAESSKKRYGLEEADSSRDRKRTRREYDD